MRGEVVWALTVICADSEQNIKWASRLCFDALERVKGDLSTGARPSAMATFLLEKIAEWRTGGNR